MVILRMFLGVFIVGSVIMFIAQFIGIDVSSAPDLGSKISLVADRVDWLVVFAVAGAAATLVALVAALRNTPIAKSLDSRDE